MSLNHNNECCVRCGFNQESIKFINSHNGNQKDISTYGQEYTSATYKLAKMNLAIRGIAANFGDVAGDIFFKDLLEAAKIKLLGQQGKNTRNNGRLITNPFCV